MKINVLKWPLRKISSYLLLRPKPINDWCHRPHLWTDHGKTSPSEPCPRALTHWHRLSSTNNGRRKRWACWNQSEFQDPKMEVLYHITPYFAGILPYIGQIPIKYTWQMYVDVLQNGPVCLSPSRYVFEHRKHEHANTFLSRNKTGTLYISVLIPIWLELLFDNKFKSAIKAKQNNEWFGITTPNIGF